MAEHSLDTEIKKRLQCGLCLKCFHEPKVLNCKHMYCKECIDQLLEFCMDGSASIKCPLNCEAVTTISCDKTTNDLDVNLYVQDMVDTLSGRDHEGVRKCDQENCDGRIASYCYNCSTMLCHQCQDIHVKHHHNCFVSVKFDERKEETRVICDEHRTAACSVCFEQGCNLKFLCMYCLQRSHKNHNNETIQVKSEQVKRWLRMQEKKMGGSVQQLNTKFDVAKKSISVTQNTLECILKNRMLKGVSEFITHAQQEEVRLLEEYDSVVKEHKEAYPETNVAEFWETFKDKEDVEIVLMEKNAIKYVAEIESVKVNLLSVNVGLTDISKLKPLGELDVTACPHINDQNAESIFTNSFDANDKCYDAANIWRNIEQILGEVIKADDLPELNNGEVPRSSDDQGIKVDDLPELTNEEIPGSSNGLGVGIVFKTAFICVILAVLYRLIIVCIRVNGGYSEWSSFSICTKTCIGGIQERKRFCNNPSPKYGGDDCSKLGVAVETQECGTEPCLVKLYLHSPVQSSTYNDNYARNALNGEVRGVGKLGGGCSETEGIDNKQWWTAKFATDHAHIVSIRIMPCTECYKDSYSDVIVYTGDTMSSDGRFCAGFGNSLQTSNTWLEVQCSDNRLARYIAVTLKGKQRLSFCEIEIWGYVLSQTDTVELKIDDTYVIQAKREYPKYNAEFIGYGFGLTSSNGYAAHFWYYNKYISTILACIEYCIQLKTKYKDINGVSYSINNHCWCESSFIMHSFDKKYLHYKLN